MIYYGVSTNEINAWWDARADMKKGYRYSLKLNGQFAGTTKRIFFDFENLNADTLYDIELSLIDTKKRTVGEVEKISIKTPQEPKMTDITKAPYFAKGDGVTDNTEIINRAVSQTDGNLFFPKGVYVCESMCINKNCLFKFEKGAIILQKERCEND